MKATVNQCVNTSKLFPRKTNLAYEVKIEHGKKHDFFYVYTGPGGMCNPQLETALRLLASDSDEWDTYTGFLLGSGYDEPDSLGPETAREYYDWLRDNSERLYKLLGSRSYEKFMREYQH
jgi:hypothetical protein